MAVKALQIELIQIDGGTQFRAATNESKVQEYAELYEAYEEWPFDSACDVFFDGASYFLVDGFHRYHAAIKANQTHLSCNVHKGTLRAAIEFALKVNGKHGLHRSNADKRKAVDFVLADAEWGKLSSRVIAEMCGVSDMFVGTVRKAPGASGLHLEPEKRTGKDGKQQPASKPKARQEVVETVYEDVDDEMEPERELEPNSVPVNSQSPQSLAAPIQAVATRLDSLLKDLAKLSDDIGGEWLDMTTIETQSKALKHTIRSGVFWVDCPDCKGKGCKTCKQHGWLSRDRKQFLTQHQKDLLGAA